MSVETYPSRMLLTSREAAEALGLTERTLFNLRTRGQISIVKIGHAVRYDPEELRLFVQRMKSPAIAA